MKNFNDYIKREDFSTLQNFFIDRGHLKTVKKKDFFAIQGHPTTFAAYIQKGIFRYTCTDEKGDEHIVGYSFSGEYLGDYPQCRYREKALVSIQAVTDAEIYYASAEEINLFLSSNEVAQKLELHLLEGLFVQTYKRLLDIYCKAPIDIYSDLINRNPDFQNYVTLKEVASFLRVTPETISHIRKKLE